MTRNRKSIGYTKKVKYLFVLFLGAMIFIASASATILPDTAKRPQPPPHPKPKSLKEIWTKINPFKKKNKDAPKDGNDQAEVDPKPTPPPPPQPQPKPVTPVTPKHKPTTKKKKTTTTPDKKTDKPAQPLI